MCHLATYFLDVSLSNNDEIVLTEYLVDIAASRASGVFLRLRLSLSRRQQETVATVPYSISFSRVEAFHYPASPHTPSQENIPPNMSS